MKVKIFFSALLISFAVTAQAQNYSEQVKESVNATTVKMAKELNLNSDQEMLVQRQNMVLQSNEAKYEAVENKTPKIEKNIEYYRSRYMESMKKILNEEQYAKFSKMMKKEKKKTK